MGNKFVDFYAKVMQSPEEHAKVAAIAAGGATEETFDKLIAYAKESGFDFTKEEVVEYFKTNFSDKGELTDDDLEAVAGGKGLKIPQYTNEEFGKSLLGIFGVVIDLVGLVK